MERWMGHSEGETSVQPFSELSDVDPSGDIWTCKEHYTAVNKRELGLYWSTWNFQELLLCEKSNTQRNICSRHPIIKWVMTKNLCQVLMCAVHVFGGGGLCEYKEKCGRTYLRLWVSWGQGWERVSLWKGEREMKCPSSDEQHIRRVSIYAVIWMCACTCVPVYIKRAVNIPSPQFWQ